MTPERQPAPVGAASYLPSPSVHSYRTLATEHEALMQKYLHLLQIVETEKTVAKQLRQQIEDGEVEIERLERREFFPYETGKGSLISSSEAETGDRKSTRLNSSHTRPSRMPSSA